MNTTNPKECPQCRGTGWCPGEELDEEIICSKCGGRGELRNTTNPAPQEKNSAPLHGVDAAGKTTAPTDALVGGRSHARLEAEHGSSSQSRLGGA